MEKDCRVRLQGAGNDFLQNVTCFECGEKGHFKDKCPKAGNQQNDGARGRAYVVVENPQQNPNVVTGTFLLNDHYACILFDSGAEKSFVSSAFTHFINIAPATLNTSYEVELADGKVVSTNTILRSCTLVLLNHVFKIDLLPTRLGSFDVIIGMDWLAYHRALIDCYEKIVRIPLPNGKILEVQGERPEKDLGSLACIKAGEKKLDDICVVRDFPEVFPDDLLGLPLVREIEFHIDLIPGASPVVRSPYRCVLFLKDRIFAQDKSVESEREDIRGPRFDPIWAFEFTVMPFGLTNAPAIFMDLMKRCKRIRQICNCVHDDILNLLKVKRRSMKPTETIFGLNQEGEVVESVKNGKTPESSTEIRSFLGLAGYYRRFIENFSRSQSPSPVGTQRIRPLPDGPDDFVVYCDASKQGFGCMLMQRGKYIGGAIRCTMDLERLVIGRPGNEERHCWSTLADVLRALKIKAEHHKPSGFYNNRNSMSGNGKRLNMDLSPKLPKTVGRKRLSDERNIQTLEDMLRACVMDFLGGSWIARDMECSWVKVSFIGTENCAGNGQTKIVQIRERLKTARSRQKSYADKRRKPLEFKVETECYLRYLHGREWYDLIKIDENLRFVEEPIKIIERDVKKLKQRRIPLVKVCWNSRQGAEYTWESDSTKFRNKYLNPFLRTRTFLSSHLEP
ncbi:putative reverse transcriptase domain-containing protein [Tanacetum coccineum]|uniref:Reverse transcriptase domain-containing protein n=1 Tax=Tanacetum coccineum TaxID=301880 RepID=A0ABQ5BY97_9ASTR